MLIEGETPSTMAKSTGLGLLELPTAFERLQPDVVITVGDRFETMATALAATYMNIPLAHTMGGEVSGNIDESIRHAVTKFAHVHFPASQGAARADRASWARTRSPCTSSAARAWTSSPRCSRDGRRRAERAVRHGRRRAVQPRRAVPARLAAPGHDRVRRRQGGRSTRRSRRVQDVGLPAIVLWPNADAGSEHIAARDAQVPRAQRRLEAALLQEPADERLHQADGEDALPRRQLVVGDPRGRVHRDAGGEHRAAPGGPRPRLERRRRRLRPRRDRRTRSARRSSTAATSREPIYGDGTRAGRSRRSSRTRELSIRKRMTY